MGEVYHARDVKLGRSVAVKIVREGLAADASLVSRLEREAKMLASLNHPHIASLHGLEEHDGRRFLVMELVEGETLADRLRRGPMPVDDVLRIAAQIAEALETAHEKGIVHRDLKPANVKITPEDKVKVLDFGLAKAIGPEPASATAGDNVVDSPTLSRMATQAGIILGTAAYMSPEQAKGLPADHRSDVFSFGVVFYEMLTGRQPFQGETAADVLASVLIRDPELSKLPPDVNPRLHDLVRRCLEKSPKRRWQAMGDLRSEIETIAESPRALPASAVSVAPRPLWRRALPVALTAVVTAGLAGSLAWRLKPTPPAPVTRSTFTLPEGQVFTNPGRTMVAISPDGARMAYVADQRLYVRALSQFDATAVRGTENRQGIANPVFSPDGQSVAFYAAGDGTIKRIAITGGIATTICKATNPYGMSWEGSDIVFGQGAGGLMRVSSTGGSPQLLVRVEPGELAYGPQILPGGEHVLFTLATGTDAGRWDRSSVVVQSLSSGDRRVVVEGAADARYLPTSHLLYAVGGTVFAAGFDPRRLTMTGTPVPVIEGVRRAGIGTGAAQFSVARTGSLVYVPGPASSPSGFEVGLIDRKGAIERLSLPTGAYEHPRASPDGRRIAFGTSDGKETDISIYDLAGTTAPRRLTFGGNNRYPTWSSDSRRITYQSDREGDLGIFWQLADGSGVERLTKADEGTSHEPESWSSDGDTLLFSLVKGTDVSLWMYSRQSRKASPFGGVRSSRPIGAMFSPDGRWVAYSSREETGGTVYVEPFPATGVKYEIPARGRLPHHQVWSPDGKELFYDTGPAAFEILTVFTAPAFGFGNPVTVPKVFYTASSLTTRRPFDILRPSGRILGLITPGQADSGGALQQIHVVTNWLEEVKARVPTGSSK
jgi:serine/threonine-protein kinase